MTKIDQKELDIRFNYHAPKGGQPEAYEYLRNEAKRFAAAINSQAPECREKSLAMTAVEQAIMWANAAIARRG